MPITPIFAFAAVAAAYVDICYALHTAADACFDMPRRLPLAYATVTPYAFRCYATMMPPYAAVAAY